MRSRLPILTSLLALLFVLPAIDPMPGYAAAGSAEGGEPPADAETAKVVVLRKFDQSRWPSDQAFDGRMGRELFRQALVVAANDGLGLAVRDEGLGESAPAGDPAATFDVEVRIRPGEPVEVVLWRVHKSGDERFWEGELPVPLPMEAAYPALAAHAEALSRGDFLQALRRAGLKGRPDAAGPRGPEPEARGPGGWNLFDEFATLRALHAAVRSGETPERLGALARAYAHLGLFTDFTWVPLSDIFHARALIYAQRLAAREPGSPRQLWDRAYVLALAGAHRSALADLEAARRAVAADDPPSQPPAWADLIEAYCRFDTERMRAEPGGPLAPMVATLRLLTVEDSEAGRLVQREGMAAMQADPENFRIYTSLSRADSGFDVMQQVSHLGPHLLTSTLPRRLREMPGLPKGVRDGLDRGGEVGAIRALMEAGRSDDAPGITWGVLGRLLREVRFALVWRRVDFMAHNWNVPVGEFLDPARPLVADHPYAAYLDAVAHEAPGDRKAYDAAIRRIKPDPAGVDLSAMPMLQALERVGEARPLGEARRQADATYRDLVLLFHAAEAPRKVEIARRLREVSPHAPFPAARLIELAWADVEPRAAEWEEAHARHPLVLEKLGRKYLDSKRWDDAERCLRKVVELSPDSDSYRALAESYKGRGQLDRYKATLDTFLATPESGLGHAGVRVELANVLMSEGRWKEAEPYAAAAANTGAGWAMNCAVLCYEGLEDWERSEQWARNISERYPYSADYWYFWCKRNNRGDEVAARRLIVDLIATLGRPVPGHQVHQVAMFYLLTGRPEKAREVYAPGRPESDSPYDKLHLALLLNGPDEAERREEVARDAARTSPWIAPIAALFARDGDSREKLHAAERDRSGQPTNRRSEMAYLIGRLHQQRGRAAEARPLLQEAARSPYAGHLTRTLAAIALRELDGPPDDPKPR